MAHPGKDNVIILTSGLTGSSVFAGLLREAGYWVGHETARKSDYDTNENAELVRLNDKLLALAGHRERFDRIFRPDAMEAVTRALRNIDCTEYQRFIETCLQNQPFLWKDPRFCLTIGFWLKLLDTQHLRVVIVNRSLVQSWISHILRRQIQSPAYCRYYLHGIRNNFLNSVTREKIRFIEVSYDAFLARPDAVLRRLDEFLGCSIPPDAVARLFNGSSRQARHGVTAMLKACLIFALNFRGRVRKVV